MNRGCRCPSEGGKGQRWGRKADRFRAATERQLRAGSRPHQFLI